MHLPPSIIDLNDKISPAILAEQVFGFNVSLVYQEVQAGRLPGPIIDYTYRQAIQAYIAWFKKNQDLKILKEQNEQTLRLEKAKEEVRVKEARRKNKGNYDVTSSGEDDLHPLVKAKMKQEIRLNAAREEQLWLKVAIERGQYISKEELNKLIIPFVITIRDMISAVAIDYPETQEVIDKIMDDLYNLGEKLSIDGNIDRENYVQAMLEKEIEV